MRLFLVKIIKLLPLIIVKTYVDDDVIWKNQSGMKIFLRLFYHSQKSQTLICGERTLSSRLMFMDHHYLSLTLFMPCRFMSFTSLVNENIWLVRYEIMSSRRRWHSFRNWMKSRVLWKLFIIRVQILISQPKFIYGESHIRK